MLVRRLIAGGLLSLLQCHSESARNGPARAYSAMCPPLGLLASRTTPRHQRCQLAATWLRSSQARGRHACRITGSTTTKTARRDEDKPILQHRTTGRQTATAIKKSNDVANDGKTQQTPAVAAVGPLVSLTSHGRRLSASSHYQAQSTCPSTSEVSLEKRGEGDGDLAGTQIVNRSFFSLPRSSQPGLNRAS